MAGGLALAGCAAGMPEEETPSRLTVVTAAEPPTMDYAASGLTGSYMFVATSIQEPLVRYDEQARETVGVLATDWDWDGDLVWTFTLREGVTFHSGDTLDAEDVVYSIERYIEPESTVASDHDSIASVEAIDELTVEITTESPDPILDANLIRTFISSKEFAEDRDDNALSTEVDGTGPYTLNEWTRGEEIVLSGYEEYWDSPPSIEEVQILFREDPSVRASMVRAGEAQLAWQVESDSPDVPQLIQQDTTSIVMMRPNTINHPALSDGRVRQAMLDSINVASVAETLLEGVAQPVTGNQPVNPGAIGYVDDLDVWEYDPDRAAVLIEEARADGVDIGAEITINPMGSGRFPRSSEFVEYAAATWNELGLNVTIEVLEPEQWVSLFHDPDPTSDTVADMLYVDSDNPTMDFSRAGRFVYSGGSASLFSDPQIDELYESAMMLTGEERNAAFQEVSRALEPVVPTLNFGVLERYHAASENLQWSPTAATDPDFVNMVLE